MKKDKNGSVARRFQEKRRELGITKVELSRQSGVCHTVISRLESGRYQYSRHLFEISDALDVGVDWLVRGRG